mgnify:CR=1 FL=1
MENSLLVHKHLIVRAEASRPPMDEEQLTEWMKEFVESIMQFDVYSCGEFDVEKICKKIKKDFDIKKIEYKFLNRETGLQDI